MSDTYKIFPAIGVARVGNSPEYYLAPETAGGLPILSNGAPFCPPDFRDGHKKMKRRAARFRVFRCPAGAEPEEVVPGRGNVQQINWEVYVANKKSAWYEFLNGSGENGYSPNNPLRNADCQGDDQRRALIIDPGPRRLEGANQSAYFSRETSPDGTFPPIALQPHPIDTLGEAHTDAQGRLIFVGGFGNSGSCIHPPRIDDFANNDGWWDDTSDGYVKATIVFNDGSEPAHADPVAVLTAPLKFAPKIMNLVTLYDTMYDTAIRKLGYRPEIYANSLWNHNYEPDFDSEIFPILHRGERYPWVVAIPPKPHQFNYSLLRDQNPAYNSLRQYYFGMVRPPDLPNVLTSPDNGFTLMPYLWGDNPDEPGQRLSSYLTVTDTQYFFLRQWAKGRFHNNGPNQPSSYVDRLTRAVLDNCVGGAFGPGIEMPWLCCNPRIYAEPFRPRFRPDPHRPLSLGLDLDGGLEPGDLCKIMAIPWQADFNDCSSERVGDRFLWWWPAQRPNFVYVAQPLIGRLQVPWVGTEADQNAPDFVKFAEYLEMVEKWSQLGFVYNVGKPDEPDFLEVERTLPRADSGSARV